MPDWPISKNTDAIILSTSDQQSLGRVLGAMGFSFGASAVWPSANKAYFVPISVQGPITIRKMFVLNGDVVSGNIDVGIYDRGGARVVSIGSTAQAGTDVIQEFDIADTLLNAGLYYLACAMDNATGKIQNLGITLIAGMSMGVAEMASAFPLPTTATFAPLSGTARIPFVAATLRTVV